MNIWIRFILGVLIGGLAIIGAGYLTGLIISEKCNSENYQITLEKENDNLSVYFGQERVFKIQDKEKDFSVSAVYKLNEVLEEKGK